MSGNIFRGISKRSEHVAPVMMYKLGLRWKTLRSITHYQNTPSIVLMTMKRIEQKNVVNDNEPLFIVILKSTFADNPRKNF